MNTNKNHELLCALVLGELPRGPEREQIEAALAESPELRAEKERIENTIGLVSQAFEGDAQLSSNAAERLLAAAQNGPVSASSFSTNGMKPAAGLHLLGNSEAPPEGWRSRDSLRAAAGFVLFLGVAFAAYQVTPQGRITKQDDHLAVLRKRARPVSHFSPSVTPSGEAAVPIMEAELAGQPDPAAMSYETPQLQSELAKVNSELSDSSATIRELDTALALLERQITISLGVVPSTAAPTPTPASKDSLASVGAVVMDRPRQELKARVGRIQVIDELNEDLDGEAVALRFELGRERARRSIDFSADSPLDSEHFNEVLGIGAGLNDSPWGYLKGQPIDLEAKVELAKGIALQPFTPRAGESPQTLYTRFYGENPFVDAREDALSTFGVDVDDASWLRTRASLRNGALPNPRSVRVEEFVNAFRPDVQAPTNGDTFAIAFEAMPQRFGADPNRLVLRVALRGKEVASFERKPLQLTFVVDVSGSMDEPNRLPLVKDTLALLVDQLGSGDSISIVSFASEAKIVQPMVPAANRTQILAAIDSLESNGGTNAEAGLVTGYEIASAQVASGVTSRVVLLSDGIANMGETDQARLTDRVAEERESGVFLNTVGVGLEPGGDAFLEQLADRGDGMATWMQDAEGARRSLIENFTGAFETIARDVKIQVEFDPQQTGRWRQIGYENRAIADQDFRNDQVDAGEVGAGHQIVALYEIELVGGLKSNRLSTMAESLATVRVRWKNPEGDEVQEVERSADVSTIVSWEGTSEGMKRSVVAARFAEVLRRSKHAGSIGLNELAKAAEELSLLSMDPDLRELFELIGLAEPLVAALPEPDAELEPLFEALRDNALRKARYELDHPLPEGEPEGASLQGPNDDDPAWIDLGKERQDLEQRLAEVLRTRLKIAGEHRK